METGNTGNNNNALGIFFMSYALLEETFCGERIVKSTSWLVRNTLPTTRAIGFIVG